MKYLENLALNYSVELLFNDQPAFENITLLEQLKTNFTDVSILFSTNNLISFVFNDYNTNTEGIDIPIQILIIKENSLMNLNKIRNSLSQTLNWIDLEDSIDDCHFSLVISDFMATSLNYTERVFVFNKFLKSLLTILPCKIIHWNYSQKLVKPSEYTEALEHETFYSIYGIVNVRYFKKNDFFIMDTMGLSSLGLPDLQCKFKDENTGLIASVLYEYAHKIFDMGDFIDDGEIINSLNLKFICTHEFSVTNPKRVILNLEKI